MAREYRSSLSFCPFRQGSHAQPVPINRDFLFDSENGRHCTPKSPAPTLLRTISSGVPLSISDPHQHCGNCSIRSLLLQHSAAETDLTARLSEVTTLHLSHRRWQP